MLKIAFASTDQQKVDLHFGGAESLVIYDVSPGRADLVGVMRFLKAEQVGESGRAGMTGTAHDKVIPKLEFVEGCAAVYAASIGSNSVRRLMKAGIQPVIVDEGHDIVDLLNEVSLALVYGGLPWVDKARKKAEATPAEAPPPPSDSADSRKLIASVDELE
ncbi:nitrogen fixation protein NifX [Rhodoblastus acidophilus]|uniref:Nitrogen fixation protein NifX n=1 Tax=Rhodoblastus acidophilus TaxID=1074 RepID=A0A212QD73_RHOAC|nr:NifB/NifX family molybdenum-iron cluster-binding protein [Rhodoblastus acidophilus]MCW2316410.1 nitrogen fixation protein NifX [Rhodoblastus acidophilus]PPQ40037.1 vanadium nitrogenase [Rhodoblastus acidophilus]RAI22319.1 vanadium nitrogenase [Rhodoblastus acidophilus]SNB57339.1 nitrogen fixation protein NifX [Rhodoblastus acidophilus]